MKNKKVKITLAENDFDEALLPKTRRAQFKDILTHEYKALLLMGGWLLLFLLPILLTELFANQFAYAYIEQNGGSLSAEEKSAFELMVTLIKEGAILLGTLVFSIGLAGSLRLIRNLVYGEPLFFKDDFLLGIRKYGGICLSNAFFFAFFKSATEMLRYMVNNHANAEYLHLFSGFAVGAFYLFVVPILLFDLSLGITYELSFFKRVGLAVRFALSNWLFALAYASILFLLGLLWYIPSFLAVLGILAFLALFAFPLAILGWHLYATSRFDKYINEKQFPEIYRSGLRKGE